MVKSVIDIGSNSVRLLVLDNGETILKTATITRLAEGMGNDEVLQEKAVERTVLAVSFFVDKAKELFSEQIHIFATAAVRQAVNKEDFCNKIYSSCGVMPQVISGETEALLGAYGALSGKDGCLIDVGGASSEIAVYKNNLPIYSFSLKVGCVSLYNLFGENYLMAQEYLSQKVTEYGKVPLLDKIEVFAVGGTATSCSAYANGIIPYNPIKNHGSVLTKEHLEKMKDDFMKLSLEEREKIEGIQAGRGKVIICGILILLAILDFLKINCFIISEKDNLEGYLGYLEGKNEQKN